MGSSQFVCEVCLLWGGAKWHNRKSSSESNIITAVHQVHICIPELVGKKLVPNERRDYFIPVEMRSSKTT